MINRKAFFAEIRKAPFGGVLSLDTVKGIDAILDEWERRRLTDKRWLAYMLATVRRECGIRMLPVREGFGVDDDASRRFVRRQGYKYAVEVNGHVYYGRGLVQLTWFDNYRKMSDLLEIDLVNHPDLALDPHIASKIMFEGMIRGTFTGKSLANYFTAQDTDWRNARKIINGLDHADEIAATAKTFWAALKSAGETTGIQQPIRTDTPSIGNRPRSPLPHVSWVDKLLSPFKRGS
jgi:putative chitinase